MGEISKIVGGGTPSTSNPEYWNGNINWYSPIEIGDSIYKRESKKKISELGLKKSSAKILPPGTILYTSRAGIGKTAILAKSGSTNQGFQSIIPLEDVLDSYFIYSRTEELRIYGEKYGSGSTFNEISGKQLEKMPIKIPTIEEQKYISQFVKHLDYIVTLHQGSINILEELKKAYLKEMFADNVNKIPNLRLNGFRKEWEQHKLGEIFNIFDNLRVPVKSSNRIYGNTPYYGANGIQDYVEGFTHKGEFILLAEDGANNLDNYPVHYVNGKVWVNNHAHVLQGKAEFIDNKFAVYLLRKTNIRKFLVGGGRAKLNANIMMQILLTIPILSEQIPIGQLLYQFDELIELHQRKLNKLEKLKTSYLNKMFL